MGKITINVFITIIIAYSVSCQTVLKVSESKDLNTNEKEQTLYLCVNTQAPDAFTDMINFKNVERITNFTYFPSGEILFGTGGLSAVFFRSKDQVKTWENVKIPNMKTVSAINFVDSQNGILIDNDFNVWKTNDGGISWGKTAQLKQFVGKFVAPQEIKFSSVQNGIMKLHDKDFYETIDGGITWKSVKIPSFSDLTLFYRLNNDYEWIIIGKNSTTMYVLRKEGVSWKQYSIPNTANFSDPTAMFFLDQNQGWINSDMGELFSTKDGGRTWKKIYSDEQNLVKGMFWQDFQTGWLVGSNKDNQAAVFKTTDGGNSWKTVEIKNEGFFSKITFMDNDNGWLISRERVYKTADGGKNWKPIVYVSLACQ